MFKLGLKKIKKKFKILIFLKFKKNSKKNKIKTTKIINKLKICAILNCQRMIHFCQQQPAIVSKIKCDNLSLQWAQLKHKKASSSHSFHFHYSQSAILSSFAQTFTISLTYINIFLNCTTMQQSLSYAKLWISEKKNCWWACKGNGNVVNVHQNKFI